MFLQQIFRPDQRTRQLYRPIPVQVRAILAVLVIMLPLFVLLLLSLSGGYDGARALQRNDLAGSLGGTDHHVAVTAGLAMLWMAVVLMLTLAIIERRVLRPLRHLTHVASRLAGGELDARVNPRRIGMTDMRRLATTINGMADIIEKLAMTDSLTAVANRRQFDTVIASEVKRSMRMRKGLALLLIDVDKFKNYNDLYGHGAGDLCLKRIATALRNTVRRSSDLVARYGGEEFVVLLPDTDASGAEAVALELLAAVRDLEIIHGAWERGIVTISIGVAVAPPTLVVDPGRLVEQADQALYAAKQAGRDRALLSETMTCAA